MKLSDLTVDYVKTSCLWGLPLTDAAGTAMPNGVITNHLAAAVREFERRVDVKLTPTVVITRPSEGDEYDEEGQPISYRHTQNGIYEQVRLPAVHVQSIQRIRGFFGDTLIYQFPIEWVHLNRSAGYFQLIPTKGSLGGLVSTSSGDVSVLQLAILRGDHLPAFWCVDYTYGLPGDSDIGEDIAMWLARQAAIPVLEMLASARLLGQSSRSISMDGVSENRGYQPAIYANRVTAFSEAQKACDFKEWRRLLRGLKVWGT